MSVVQGTTTMSDKITKWLSSAQATIAIMVSIAAAIVYGTTVVNKVEATAVQLRQAQDRADDMHKQLIKSDIESANDILRLREAILVMSVNFQYISNQLSKITK